MTLVAGDFQQHENSLSVVVPSSTKKAKTKARLQPELCTTQNIYFHLSAFATARSTCCLHFVLMTMRRDASAREMEPPSRCLSAASASVLRVACSFSVQNSVAQVSTRLQVRIADRPLTKSGGSK